MNVFDAALSLNGTTEGHFVGATHPDWENMVGPFGGMTAAVMLNAVVQDARRLGDPIALTVNFCSAVAPGAFQIEATPLRTNRSTQHWTIVLKQQGQTVITATVVTAARRETWSTSDAIMPVVGTPQQSPLSENTPLEWTKRYHMRPIQGALPSVWDGSESSSLTQQWVRHAQARQLDLLGLTALCDSFFPRVYLRRAKPVPIGTVSMTCYFHWNNVQLASHVAMDDYLLCQSQGQTFRNGFFDQTGLLWSEAGVLLASTTQIVYFKE